MYYEIVESLTYHWHAVDGNDAVTDLYTAVGSRSRAGIAALGVGEH